MLYIHPKKGCCTHLGFAYNRFVNYYRVSIFEEWYFFVNIGSSFSYTRQVFSETASLT